MSIYQPKKIIKRSFSNVSRGSAKVEQDWFPQNKSLIDSLRHSQSSNMLHFSFVEGSSGTAKSDLLRRLERQGYKTVYAPFPSNFSEFQNWSEKLDKEIGTIKLQFNSGILRPKNNLVFVYRSFLSSWGIFGQNKSFALQQMYEFKKSNSSAVILAKADELIAQQRVSKFLLDSIGGQVPIVGDLVNQSIQKVKETNERYDELLSTDLIDAILQTTSVKQASNGILRLYGIDFSFKQMN